MLLSGLGKMKFDKNKKPQLGDLVIPTPDMVGYIDKIIPMLGNPYRVCVFKTEYYLFFNETELLSMKNSGQYINN